MKILILFFIIFITLGCNNNISVIKKELYFDNIKFDVVEKKVQFNPEVPSNIKETIIEWFNNHIKTDGYDGVVEIKINDYKEKLSDYNGGKKFEVNLSFEVIIKNNNLSQIKNITGKVNTFSTITGEFSLSELDNLMYNTRIDLIFRLNEDLKSKI